MSKWAALAVLMALVLTTGLTQELKIHTRPQPPPREVLDRLRLTQAWRVHLKMDSLRDGLVSVQVIPGQGPKDNPQVVAQTYSGVVVLLDAETGDTLWRATVGQPYWPGKAVAYNSSSIIVARREFLYVLNRANGAHRVYRTDKSTKERLAGFQMLAGPSAAPIADEDAVYLPMHTRVLAYDLPGVPAETPDMEPAPARSEDVVLPDFRWSYLTTNRIFVEPPVGTATQVSVVAMDGALFSLSKFDIPARRLRFDFKFQGPVSVAMAQHGDVAYVGSEDTILYALNMVNSQLLWRYFSGGPLRLKPEATDRDVFASPDRIGLIRLDRDTGREIWANKTAQRFLATNYKYLYATDRIGQLLVLDYHRGTTLAKYDTSEWIMPLSNDLTDRVYFANHDGQILCLRHRDEREPVRTKTVVAELPPKEEVKEEKKEPGPEKEPEKKEKMPEEKKEKEVDKDKQDKKKEQKEDKEAKDKVGMATRVSGCLAEHHLEARPDLARDPRPPAQAQAPRRVREPRGLDGQRPRVADPPWGLHEPGWLSIGRRRIESS